MAEQKMTDLTNEQFKGVPKEWFDANPDKKPSDVAEAYLLWQSQQPDIVGKGRKAVLDRLTTGAKEAGTEDTWAHKLTKMAVSGLMPESMGELAGDVAMSAIPPVRVGSGGARALRAIERGAVGGGVAGGVDYAAGASGEDAAMRGALVGGTGLAGDALAQTGRFVRRNVMETGVREADVQRIAESVSHVFQPSRPGPQGFYQAIIGREAKDQVSDGLNYLEHTWVNSFRLGGQTPVALTGIEQAVRHAGMKGVRPTTIPGPHPITLVTVDEARDTIRRLKAMGRTARDTKEPLSVAKAQEAQRMANELEQELFQMMPPQGQAAYTAFNDYARQSNAIVPFLRKVAKMKGPNPFITETPNGPEFNIGALSRAFKDKAQGVKSPNLEVLERMGFDDFIDAVTRGAGVGAADKTHGPISVLGALASHGPRTTGIPVPGTKFTEFAGETGDATRGIIPSVLRTITDPRVGAAGAEVTRRGLMSFGPSEDEDQ